MPIVRICSVGALWRRCSSFLSRTIGRPAPANRGVAHLHELRGVIEREKAEIGVLLCTQEPTGPMRKECADAGFYKSPWGKHSRLQVLTIEDLLTGKTIDRPPAQTSVTFKRAPKAATKGPKRKRLDFENAEDVEPL